jgi:hypothetical protein
LFLLRQTKNNLKTMWELIATGAALYAVVIVGAAYLVLKDFRL